MKREYFDATGLVERLHRQFLEVVSLELDRLTIKDINNVQCLILHNISDDELTVGELTNRGYYLGSNVSYNLKKMVANGYVEQKPSLHDRRIVQVHLSEKGKKLRDKIALMYSRHQERLPRADLSEERLAAMNETLRTLGRFWSNILSQRSDTTG